MCNLAGSNNHQKRVQQNGFSRMLAKISYICNTNAGALASIRSAEHPSDFKRKFAMRLDLLFVIMHEKGIEFLIAKYTNFFVIRLTCSAIISG